MRRRAFITLLGTAAAQPLLRPLAARAQQSARVRRVGVLMSFAPDDPESQARLTAFAQGLQESGWSDGRNIRLDFRFAPSGNDLYHKYASELLAHMPDAILASGGQALAALLQLTRNVPIVFAQVTDPVGAGFVGSLARPGGNATGFTQFEYGISGKWLELLKQIAPNVTRVAVIRDPAFGAGIGQFGAIQSVAPSFGIELSSVGVTDPGEMERAIMALARAPNAGLIVVTGATAIVRRELIIGLAAKYGLPAVYPYRLYVRSGGLISYGPDSVEPFRGAAGYVDRILRGASPGDLPVQTPTKLDLVFNLKTAKALGLSLPASLLATADEVIE
jgi:putative tryptophan/tyrosine transport system substrate-binding protein